ncbi:MAG: FHA domain-containing protein [Acidobacteriota bacterium]
MNDANSDSGWRAPDADDSGFVPYDTLQRRARELGDEAFLRAYPHPALLVTQQGQLPRPGDIRSAASPDSGVQLLTMSVKSTAILSYLGKVGFVCKRPGNLFAHLISIGRSIRNDVIISVDTLSKVHGYFVHEDNTWQFNDHGSTNGSLLNNRPLEPGVRLPLKSGDVLVLGPDVALEFLPADDLLARLRGRPLWS